MAEELIVEKGTKEEKYRALLPQVQALLEGESDLIAGMANVAAALKQTFDHFWIGFYRVVGEQLLLSPFQGPIACTRIAFGKGVCGTAWKQKQTLIVADVDRFPGHIACNSASKSEIVVPLFRGEQVIAVLDIDSDQLDSFDERDAHYLEQICRWLAEGAG